MVNEEQNVLNFGSEELNKELEYEGGDFLKPVLGEPINIEVVFSKGVVKQIKEFEANKPVVRFNLTVNVNDTEKIWSVSRKVLNIINDYADSCNLFPSIGKQ